VKAWKDRSPRMAGSVLQRDQWSKRAAI